MKKALIMAAAMLATVSAFAQGTVNFSNLGSNGVAAVFNSLTGANAIAGSTFNVQLYYLPDNGNPATDPFMPLGLNVGLSAAGFFVGGNRTAPVTPPGAFAYFQVRAWETAFGTSYESALNANPVGGRGALTGKSNIVRVDTGDPTTIPPGTAGNLVAAGLQRIELTPIIPEPSVIGLGLLGAGALLLLRRRK
jgi:hypothetical protein